MRILVLEYVTGGGRAGRPLPGSLAREGAAMRDALVRDLALLPHLQVSLTVDPRYPLDTPASVRSFPVGARAGWPRRFLEQADAVWLIAPETAGCLGRLAALVESTGRRLLGPASSAIRAVADRPNLLRRLARAGLPVPETRVLRREQPAPAALPWPAAVVKPGRGAGGEAVSLLRAAEELPAALAAARAADGAPVLLQRFIPGTAASVSLLCHDTRVLPLALNGQDVRFQPACAYRGGETPLAHPLAGRALEVAAAACRLVPGLRGYVGVDLVLTDEDAVLLEINPRLTTSYLGLRRSLDANPAALALEAALGQLPPPPAAVRRVWFSASGDIVREAPLSRPERTSVLAEVP